MIKKIFFVLKKIPFLTGDTSSAQLIRTYVVGGFNLVFGLFLVYIFQFFILNSVQVPLRTYLTNIFGFTFGVIISYFLSRRLFIVSKDAQYNYLWIKIVSKAKCLKNAL